MKADKFLFAFRKFAARWGTPEVVVSDNAPQFAVVDGVFRDIWKQFAASEITSKYYAQYEIKWKFIAPEAPWMGGV